MRARLAAVTLLALALVLPAGAQAHAFLEASTPASGTSLARAPHVVSLRFTEPVSAVLTHVQLFDGHGEARSGVRVSRGRTASELAHLAAAAFDRRLPPHLLDRLAGRSPRHPRCDRLRRRRVGAAVGPARRRVAAHEHQRERRHLFDLAALCVLIAICSLLAAGLPAAVRARVLALRPDRPPRPAPGRVLVALAGKTSRLPWRDGARHTAWGHAMLASRARHRQRWLIAARHPAGRGSRSACSFPSRRPRLQPVTPPRSARSRCCP